jgi:hypothetical protein
MFLSLLGFQPIPEIICDTLFYLILPSLLEKLINEYRNVLITVQSVTLFQSLQQLLSLIVITHQV